MTRISVDEVAGGNLEHADPRSREHVLVVLLRKIRVGALEHASGIEARKRLHLDDGFRLHHEQCRRYALARYVGHNERQMIVVDHEEVVEIAAHLARRLHGRVQIELVTLRDGRRDVGKRVRLNACRHIEVGLHERQRLLEHSDRLVDVVGKRGELRNRTHIDHHVQVASGNLAKLLIHLADAEHDATPDDGIDDQEQRSEDKHLHEPHDEHRRVTRRIGLFLGQQSTDAVAFNLLIDSVATLVGERRDEHLASLRA